MAYNMKPPVDVHSNTHNIQSSPVRQRKVIRKRKANMLRTYDDILADDIEMSLRKEARSNRNDISLGECVHHDLKANFLGPIVKRRFIDRFSEAPSAVHTAPRARSDSVNA